MFGKRSDWTQVLADDVAAVLKSGEVRAACSDAKLLKLAIQIQERWQEERARFKVAIASTTASRLARKLKDLRNLEEGTQSCMHYEEFWYSALAFPNDSDEAWCVRNFPDELPLPSWLSEHAKALHPLDWETRIKSLAGPGS